MAGDMDPTVTAALIGGAATVAAAYIGFRASRRHSGGGAHRGTEGETSERPTTSTDRSKYITDASNATGVAIGDEPKVEQHLEEFSQRDAPGDFSASDFTLREQRAALEQELAQRERNLARLRAKKGVYAEGEEPRSLLNQIEAEDREIRRIRTELDRLPR